MAHIQINPIHLIKLRLFRSGLIREFIDRSEPCSINCFLRMCHHYSEDPCEKKYWYSSHSECPYLFSTKNAEMTVDSKIRAHVLQHVFCLLKIEELAIRDAQ